MYVYTYHIFIICSSIDEHLGSKTHGNVLAIEKSQISYNVFAVANEKLPVYQTISFFSCTNEVLLFFCFFFSPCIWLGQCN